MNGDRFCADCGGKLLYCGNHSFCMACYRYYFSGYGFERVGVARPEDSLRAAIDRLAQKVRELA